MTDANDMIGKFVVIRTDRAGVHCGELVSVTSIGVRLSGARRIWRWRGANTLHEVATDGCDAKWTRISTVVETIELLDALEIIPCTDAARDNLMVSRWPT